MSSSPAAISHPLTSPSSFSLVPGLASSGRKASGLFKLIGKDQALLESDGYHIVKGMNSEHPAFFIEMAEVPPLGLRGYQRELAGRHLTVDEFYRSEHSDMGIRGYLYAHYTESYRNGIGEQVIVHVYFNRLGKILTVQAKTRPSNTYLDLAPQEEAQIRKNAQEASAILQELLTYKSEKYEKAINEAARLDIELTKLSIKLQEEGAKERYIKLAKEFLEQVHLINLCHDFEYDARGDIVKQRLKFLSSVGITIPADLFSSPTKEEAEIESVEMSDQPVAAKPPSSPKIDLFSLIEKQEQELDRLMAASSQKTAQKIKILEQARDLQDCLLALSFREDLKKKEKGRRKTLIARIEHKIKKVPNFSDLVEEAYGKGDVESFKLLFSFNRYSATCLKSLKGILFLLISQEGKGQLCKSLMAICGYLFENSENYRQFMSFSVGKKQVVGLMIVNNEDIPVSPLVKAMQKNDTAVFNMLLDHGYNPNHLGLAYNGFLTSALRACITFSGCDKKAIYLKLLLEKGASVNQERLPAKTDLNSIVHSDHFQEELLFSAKKDVKHAKEIFSPKRILPDAEKQILNYSINGSTDLVYACVIGHFSAIPMLQAASNSHNLFDLTLAMSSLRYRKEFCRMQIVNQGNFGLSFISSTDEKIIAEFFQLKSDFRSPSQMQVVVAPTVSATSDSIVAMQGLYDAFIKKYQSSPSEIEPAIEKLVKCLKDCLAIQERNLANHYYEAALSLIIQKGVLTQQDVTKIMQLEQYMAALYLAGKNPNQDRIIKHCKNTLKAATSLGYFEVLNEHPLFKLATGRLKKFSTPQRSTVSHSSSASVSVPPPVARLIVPVSVNQALLTKEGVVDLKIKWENATLMPPAEGQSVALSSGQSDGVVKGNKQAVSPLILYSRSYPINELVSSNNPAPAAQPSAAASAQPVPSQAPAAPKDKKKKK